MRVWDMFATVTVHAQIALRYIHVFQILAHGIVAVPMAVNLLFVHRGMSVRC